MQKSIKLMTPGDESVIEVKGDWVAVERFIEHITTPRADKSEATKPDLPNVNTEMYIFPNRVSMVLAKNEWEKEYRNWPSQM